jgi:hypothetical protein
MLRNNYYTIAVSVLDKDKYDIEPYYAGSILKHS